MIKLFTHTDLDGIGCSVVARCFYTEDELDITYVNYNEVDKAVEEWISNSNKYDKCYITDISVNMDVAEKLNNIDTEVLLFDHHVTALGLNKYDWCTVKVENDNGIKTCGTELFFEYLWHTHTITHNVYKNLRCFSDIVRDYDTWRWITYDGGEICKRMNDLFHIYKRDEFIEHSLNFIKYPIVHDINNFFNDNDNAILDYIQKDIDYYVNSKEQQMIKKNNGEYNIGIVFADRYISELGNKICSRNPDIDFIVIVNIGLNVISYRTVKDIDVSIIAQKYGGGGHPKAAGSPIPVSEETFNNILNTIF